MFRLRDLLYLWVFQAMCFSLVTLAALGFDYWGLAVAGGALTLAILVSWRQGKRRSA